MKKIKCIHIEDESLGRDIVRLELQKLSYMDLVAVADNLEDAEKVILFHKPDLLFLDIEVSGESIFDLLLKLEKWNLQFELIFITAYPDQYMKQAVESCGLKYKFAYLGKPIHSPRFKNLLEGYKERFGIVAEPSPNRTINFKFQGGTMRLEYDEIFYIETAGNDAMIYLTNDQREVVSHNLTSIESQLPTSDFYRISARYLINLKYFRKQYSSINNKRLCVIQYNGAIVKLPIPIKRWPEFKKALNLDDN